MYVWLDKISIVSLQAFDAMYNLQQLSFFTCEEGWKKGKDKRINTIVNIIE